MSKKRAATRKPQPKAPTPTPERTLPSAALAGKRLRVSGDTPLSALAVGLQFLAPPDPESDWRLSDLDRATFDRIKPAELLERLVDLSPEVSRALYDFLRMVNPGWEVRALRPNSEAVDRRAQAAVDEFLATLKSLYGSVDVVINRLYLNAFMRGGFFAELVLDNAGRAPVDLATPDSRWIQFMRVADPERGPIWQLFQWIGGTRVPLDRPTIRYVPVDPKPGSPYGRALATPALFASLFLLSLLHDLKRVIAQQGYPRLDLEVDLDVLKQIMPAHLANDPDEIIAWVGKVVKDINEQYSKLEPDDAYTHPSTVKVNRPVGTVDSSSLGAVDGLIKALERMLARALKTSPLHFGITEGMSEANANRLHELAAAGCKAIQHLCEGLLEHLLTVALQAQGIQARIEFRFAELRAAELLRDSQVEKNKLQNAALAYWLGLVSADEMATMALGKDKADVPEPRLPGVGVQAGGGGGGGASNPNTVEAEPGSNRARRVAQLRALVDDTLLDVMDEAVEVTAEAAEEELAEAGNGAH